MFGNSDVVSWKKHICANPCGMWDDGYLFSKGGKNRAFNSDMVLYYLNEIQIYQEPPENLLDQNIRTDYGKLGNLIRFQTPDENIDIINEILLNGTTSTTLSGPFLQE